MKRESLSSFRHPPESTLSKFRAAVRKLKAEGLIPPNKQGKQVKPGSARPGDMYQGKPLREYVKDKDNQAVIEGKATTIARSRVNDTQGFKVKKPKGGKDRVIIPLPEDAKVSVEKKNIIIKHESETGSIKRTLLPRKNLQQYLTDASKLPELKGNRFYAFYFYGHRSHQIFRNAEDLVEYLTAYDALETESSRKEKEIFRNLEILEINNAAGEWERKAQESTVRSRKESSRKRNRTFKQRVAKMPQYKRDIFRQKRTEYMRRYRAKKRG